MPAYVIADVVATDLGVYAEYQRRIPATIEKFGGRFIVRGGELDLKEGPWKPARIVIVEFPNLEQARDWYDSPGYAEVMALRKSAGTTHGLVIVDGLS